MQSDESECEQQEEADEIQDGHNRLRLDFQELVSEVDKYVVYQIYAETIRGYPVCKFPIHVEWPK